MKFTPFTFLKSSAGIASAVLASGAVAAAATSMSLSGSASGSAEADARGPELPAIPEVTLPSLPDTGDVTKLVAVPDLGTVELIAEAGTLLVGDIHTVGGVTASVVQEARGAVSIVFDGPDTKVVEAVIAEGDRIVTAVADTATEAAAELRGEVEELVSTVTVPSAKVKITTKANASADADADGTEAGASSGLDLSLGLGN